MTYLAALNIVAGTFPVMRVMMQLRCSPLQPDVCGCFLVVTKFIVCAIIIVRSTLLWTAQQQREHLTNELLIKRRPLLFHMQVVYCCAACGDLYLSDA